MQNTPDIPDIVTLLRDADEEVIRQRLDELDAEASALRTLLRAVRARRRATQGRKERPNV